CLDSQRLLQRQQRERAGDVGRKSEERDLQEPPAGLARIARRMTFTELPTRVREHLGQQHRYAHCVRVARMSENLARIHGASPEKARTAGMLHDLARLYSADKLMRDSVDYGLEIDEYALEHPVVLHAPLSA